MKKLGIFFISLLTVGFVACDDHSDLGIMQTNPQEALMSANGLTVEHGEAVASDAINLADFQDANVPVINIVSVENLPEGANISFKMDIAADENYSKFKTIDVAADGTVACKDWDDAFRALLGKAPFAKDNYIRFAAYVADNGQNIRLGDQNTYYAAKKINVTPIDLNIQIEEAYYLLGTINGWSVAEAIKFNHSDASVYDDPVFTLKVDISPADAEAGWWWKIVPESTYVTGNWVDAANGSYGVEVNGSEATEGMLIGRTATEDCGAGCLKTSGQLLLTINMLDCTYAFTSAVENLWTPGNSNGWNHANAQMLYTFDYANYMGFAYLNGEFKFSEAADWDHTNYGKGDADGTISTTGGNLNSGSEGLFWCNVNTASLTYSLTPIATLGAIGDFNGWGSSVNLTPSADFLTWTGEVTFTGTGSWKLRANDDWTDDWGGSVEDLQYKGSNIADPGEGTYVMTVNVATLPYTVTFEKK